MANEEETDTKENEILEDQRMGKKNRLVHQQEERKDRSELQREREQSQEQGASAQGEPHSRVGGILECNPPGNKNSPASKQRGYNENAGDGAATGEELSNGIDVGDGCAGSSSSSRRINTDDTEHSLCRYALGATSTAMSFIEFCQIRLQYLFPHLVSTPRYSLCVDSIESTAECLAHDVIRYLLKEDIYLISRDPISRSMRQSVYQILNKHSILFTSMVRRLSFVPDTAYETFMEVADELFSQGDVTWAKIVCLYALMGRLALWARDCRMHSLKKNLPHYVSRFVSEKAALFIKGDGGWGQLCILFPVAEEISGAVWRRLLMTGATLGLVALILTVTS